MALVPSTSVGGTASAGAIAQIYDNIAAGAIASWDVTGIAATYTHLQIVLSARVDAAVATTSATLRFNNDSGANYDTQYSRGSAAAATAVESLGQTSAYVANVSGASATAGISSSIVMWLADYANTTFRKQIMTIGMAQGGITTGLLNTFLMTSGWRDTSAISRVTVLPGSGNFIAGSRLTIYGLT